MQTNTQGLWRSCLLIVLSYCLLLQSSTGFAQPQGGAANPPQRPAPQAEAVQVVEVKDLPSSVPYARIGPGAIPAAIQEKAQSLGYELAPAPEPKLAKEVTLASAARKWKITIEIGNVVITIGNKGKQAARLAPNSKAGIVTMIDGDKRYEVLLIAEGGNLERVTEHAVGATAANARGWRFWNCFRAKLRNTGCGGNCAGALVACGLGSGWSGYFQCVAGRCGNCWLQAVQSAFQSCV